MSEIFIGGRISLIIAEPTFFGNVKSDGVVKV